LSLFLNMHELHPTNTRIFDSITSQNYSNDPRSDP